VARDRMMDVMRTAGYEAMQAALADGATIMPIIGMPPVMSNDPERYVDQIFEKVLQTFSREDTLTCSLQDWRKGRRAEIADVNGLVVDVLARQGRDTPMNRRVVEIGHAQHLNRAWPPANAAAKTRAATGTRFRRTEVAAGPRTAIPFCQKR
jgi:2-dehydropantoate 2-reductase